MVRFPVATMEIRQRAPRVETVIAQRPADSNNDKAQFARLDFVVTAFLFLSVFSAPALVWALLSAPFLG